MKKLIFSALCLIALGGGLDAGEFRDDFNESKTQLIRLFHDILSTRNSWSKVDYDIQKITEIKLTKIQKASNFDDYGEHTFADNYYSFRIQNRPCLAFRIEQDSLQIASTKERRAAAACKQLINDKDVQKLLSYRYLCKSHFVAKRKNDELIWEFSSQKADGFNQIACELSALPLDLPKSINDKYHPLISTKIDGFSKSIFINFHS